MLRVLTVLRVFRVLRVLRVHRVRRVPEVLRVSEVLRVRGGVVAGIAMAGAERLCGNADVDIAIYQKTGQNDLANAVLVMSVMDKKPPVRKHGDLIAWQLCHELRRRVLRYTRTGPAAREFDYRRQLRKAARSACYNTSEGFYRYKHGEFGNMLNIAHGSLGEVLDQINEGLENKYFTEEQHTEMKRFCLRALKHLSTPAPQHPST